MNGWMNEHQQILLKELNIEPSTGEILKQGEDGERKSMHSYTHANVSVCVGRCQSQSVCSYLETGSHLTCHWPKFRKSTSPPPGMTQKPVFHLGVGSILCQPATSIPLPPIIPAKDSELSQFCECQLVMRCCWYISYRVFARWSMIFMRSNLMCSVSYMKTSPW